MSVVSGQQNGTHRIYNFSAGPAALPLEVLEKVKEELLDFQGTGMSIMEMSHRSKEFMAVLDAAKAGVKKHLGVSDDYEILFLQGGASHQFAMVPLNLQVPGKPVDLINTGVWTDKAKAEIEKITTLNIVACTKSEKFSRLPKESELKYSSDAAYLHMCSNNTVAGTQYKSFDFKTKAPIVSDMSSDIFSRPIDVSKFGLIFAGAQKNIGPAGVTLVIIRKDLAERAPKEIPTILQYRCHIEGESMYNTPPTFGIYIVNIVMDWLEAQGGIKAMEAKNEAKAKLLYDAIDATDYYYSPIEKNDRSLMNVVFRIKGNDEAVESRFAKEAEAAGLSGLKGHRLVGGLRASIYNAQTSESVQALVDFMKEFEKKNG
jgi:phosphoserine aminotransferase